MFDHTGIACFEKRHKDIEKLLSSKTFLHSKLVDTRLVDTGVFMADPDACVQPFLHQAMQEDYEGVMVRLSSEEVVRFNEYRPGMRSPGLLKVKTFLQEEYQVVGINVMANSGGALVGSVTCELEDGRTFNATPANTDEEKKEVCFVLFVELKYMSLYAITYLVQ